MGVHISDISAMLEADGDRLQLVQFSGHAGMGTLGASGTISLAAPMHVDLTFTAENAQPIASDLLTATIDSHLTVQGDVQGNLNAAGTLHLRRAEIRVPDKMPASVAVLPVRNAGSSGPSPGRRGAARRAASRANAAPAAPAAAAPAIAAPAAAAPATNVALDITLDAPQEVFIRGRGLDVELGGTCISAAPPRVRKLVAD